MTRRGPVVVTPMPFDQLERYLLRCHGPDDVILQQSANPMLANHLLTDERIGTLVGRDRVTVGRWRHCGHVPHRSADRVAVELGVTGFCIWGSAFYEASAA